MTTARGIVVAVKSRRIRWSLVVMAFLCLVMVAGGVVLLVTGNETGRIYGWGLVGFFGSGVVVLARQAFAPQ